MIAKFFDMPVQSGGSFASLSDCHVFDTNRIVDYGYTKRWTKVGEFELVLPFDMVMLGELSLNGFVCFDDGIDLDWLWVQELSYDGQTMTLSGKGAEPALPCSRWQSFRYSASVSADSNILRAAAVQFRLFDRAERSAANPANRGPASRWLKERRATTWSKARPPPA